MPVKLKPLLRNFYIRAKNSIAHPFTPKDAIPFLWWEGSNWGDALNKFLIAKLSGKSVRGIDFGAQYPSQSLCYLVIGSTLAFADKNTVVWGAGFRYAHEKLSEQPIKISAVRGPLSHRMLEASGIKCSPAYGDPALLMPLLYRPSAKSHFDLGIIPHYRDYQAAVNRFGSSKNLKVINVRSGTFSFIDQIRSCSAIATSSLHGLITADAYGIPAVWIEFSKGTHGKTIKFDDYAESVGREISRPIHVNDETSATQLMNEIRPFEMQFDSQPLLDSCPFLERKLLGTA